MIKDDIFGEIFNVVADVHPTRREYYKIKDKRNQTSDIKTGYKIVDNTKMKEIINYTLQYPNPLFI